MPTHPSLISFSWKKPGLWIAAWAHSSRGVLLCFGNVFFAVVTQEWKSSDATHITRCRLHVAMGSRQKSDKAMAIPMEGDFKEFHIRTDS